MKTEQEMIEEMMRMADKVGIKYTTEGKGKNITVEFKDNRLYNFNGELLAANSTGSLMEYIYEQLNEAVAEHDSKVSRIERLSTYRLDDADKALIAANV